jgi:hypothetical protein
MTAVEQPIDLAALRGGALTVDPWPHALLTSTFIDRDTTCALTDSFPNTGFTPVRQDTSVKQFVNEVRNDIYGPDLAQPWRALLRQVTTTGYRTALEELTGLDLSAGIVRAAFWRYGPECWLSPHPDDESKIVSHVMYFNADWPIDGGGRLLINRSNDMTDVQTCVVPVAGTSVVIVRTDASWHAVEPLAENCPRPRHSLTVVFHRPGFDLSYYGQ